MFLFLTKVNHFRARSRGVVAKATDSQPKGREFNPCQHWMDRWVDKKKCSQIGLTQKIK